MPPAGNRALFLDRDGVINVDHGYVHSVENFDFVDGIFDLTAAAHAMGYRLVVVTNQAGIGRGYFSEAVFRELTDWMCAQFEVHGAPIEKVYFSPFHPTAGIGEYRKDEDTRKPGPGMILKAGRELGLSLEDSILIGDKASDILAGVAAGVGLNLLLSDQTPGALAGIRHVAVAELRDAIAHLASPGTATALG